MLTYQRDEFGPIMKLNIEPGKKLPAEEALIVGLVAVGEQLRSVNARLSRPVQVSSVSISGNSR